MRRGVVPCQLALAMRVFTRPVSVVLPRLGLGSWCGLPAAAHQGVLAPGSLAPSVCPVPRVRRHIRTSSWTLRFSSPEAVAAPFVSPRNQHGSHGTYRSATLQSRMACSTGERRKALPGPEAMPPRRPTPRHPQVRTSPDLPPSGRGASYGRIFSRGQSAVLDSRDFSSMP